MSEAYQKTHAFNLALTGVKVPWDLDKFTLVRIAKWGNSASRNLDRKIDYGPLSPSELNVKDAVDTGMLALLVGIRPESSAYLRHLDPLSLEGKEKDFVDKVNAAKPAMKKQSVNSLASLDTLPIWDEPVGCAKIVVAFGIRKDTRYFELRNKDETGVCSDSRGCVQATDYFQLCLAHPVDVTDVFFLQEFRDDNLRGKEACKSGWAGNIKAYITSRINKDLAGAGFREPRSTAQVQFKTETAQLLDIGGMSKEYAVSGATWVLNELETAVKNLDAELAKEKVPDMVALYHLLNVKEQVSEQQLITCLAVLKVS